MTTRFKHVGFLVKRDDMTFGEFCTYWVDVHAKLGLAVPGVRGYTINPIDRTIYPDAPADGFSEVYFDSLQDAEAGWASSAGEVLFADVPNFVKSLTVANLEEIVIVPRR